MKKDKLFLVFFGHAVRENNYSNFWQSFINIQKSIPERYDLVILGHVWDTGDEALINYVFSPVDIDIDKQQNYFLPYEGSNIDPLFYQRNLIRSHSTYSKVSVQSVLGQAKTKEKAIKLLENHNLSDSDLVLLVRWDIGISGSKAVNQVIFEKTISRENIILPYFSELDEGFPDMWFLGPYSLIKKMKSIYDDFLESLVGANSYLTDFSTLGELNQIQSRSNKKKLSKYINLGLNKRTVLTIKQTIINYLLYFYKYFKINSLKSNKLPLSLIMQDKRIFYKQYPPYQALNSHSLLKYLFYKKNLILNTIFLSSDDFQKHNSGNLIQPNRLAVVIYSHCSYSDLWIPVISRHIKNFIYPHKLYLLVDFNRDLIANYVDFFEANNVNLIHYNDKDKYTVKLKKGISEVKEESIYFYHEDMPLIKSIEAQYLNALLKYMLWNNIFYIRLVDTTMVDKKIDNNDFPNTVINQGGYSFSIQPSLLKKDDFLKFISKAKLNIYELEGLEYMMNNTFISVKGSKFKNSKVLVNDKFPHIVTAIEKGKWDTKMWKKEINHLVDEFNININDRGIK